eukprot:2764531-Rhodomonas_salina.1
MSLSSLTTTKLRCWFRPRFAYPLARANTSRAFLMLAPVKFTTIAPLCQMHSSRIFLCSAGVRSLFVFAIVTQRG